MCLYVREVKPRIAKSDIVVLKYLTKEGKNFKSPCQGTKVELGKIMVAYPPIPSVILDDTDSYNREISAIGRGVIHAKLSDNREYGNYCAKAIIPKGTKYWIDSFGTEIAAEQMFITEEEGSNKVLEDKLAQEILKEAPELNGIRIGDYLMKSGKYTHPKKNIVKAKVVGIVCGFYKDETPIVCALQMFSERWTKTAVSEIGEHTNSEKAMTLFNGRNVTRKYIERNYNKDQFPAFEVCINYRKSEGEEWFFGALGENMAIADNAIYLNAAHTITGLGFTIDETYWYWSCSENSLCFSFYCSLECGKVWYSNASKNYTGGIIPFYASSNKMSKLKRKTGSLIKRFKSYWQHK